MSNNNVPESDLTIGAEAYISYCSGLAIVQHPLEMVTVHNRPNIDEYSDEIVKTASEIMISGLKKIMYVSQPLDEHQRHRALQQGEKKFSEVEPAMRKILEFACEEQKSRLLSLNESYPILRPAPFLQEPTYKKLASGRYPRIKFSELLREFAPDVRLTAAIHRHDVSNRSLAKY